MLLPTIDQYIHGVKIKPENLKTKIRVEKTKAKPEPELYDINIKNYKVENGVIEKGMFLGTLFSKYHVPAQISAKIVEKTKGIFDVRKIKNGQNYTVLMSKDSLSQPDYIIYEKNKVDYVVFDFTDTLNVYTGQKQVTTQIKQAGAIIESALWFAMEDAGVNPVLANDLSEIYAWSIDFFGLQKNDKFKIIYEEHFVDGKSIGYGKIQAAFFEHNGQAIYAVPFQQDSVVNFYDTDGSALRKAFLKAPLKYSRIASRFSNSRLHPILKIRRPHHGVDYAAPMGTPVYALGDGTVIHAAYSGGAGNYIKIKHNGVYTTGYMHLRGYAPGIKTGVRVTQGQLIGFVGSTGLSTGAHLDFRVWKNGQAVNPLHIDAPPVEPVLPEKMDSFIKIRDSYKKRLDDIEYTFKEE